MCYGANSRTVGPPLWRLNNEITIEKLTPRHFKKGDLVGLSTKNLRFKGAERKLAPRFIGPFRVLEKIGLQAYRLALPESMLGSIMFSRSNCWSHGTPVQSRQGSKCRQRPGKGKS